MNRFEARNVEITVKDMKTKVVINGVEILEKSVSFCAEMDSMPTVTLELPIFPEDKTMKAEIGKVNILGTEYTLQFKSDEDVCAAVCMNIGDCGGYCSFSEKEIVIANLDKCDDSENCKTETKRCNIRHEIVHAFLSESGLGPNSNGADCWAENEEMVDWFALQGPKIYKAWQEAGAV